jgi:hypothetical protein
VASYNHLFSAELIGRQLEIANKVNTWLLHSALQIEFMKYYLKYAPELSTNIALDIKQELFG